MIKKLHGFISADRKFVVFGIIALLYSFSPVILDFMYNQIAYGLFENEMIAVNEKAFCTVDTGEISRGKIVSQSFISEFETISSIELKASIYDGDNTGLNIRLLDDRNGAIVEKWHVDISNVANDSTLLLKCEKPLSHMNMKGNVFRIEILVDDLSNGSGMGLYEMNFNSYANGELLLDGRATGQDLVMKISGYNGTYGMENVKIWISFYKLALLLGFYFWVKTIIEGKQRNQSE